MAKWIFVITAVTLAVAVTQLSRKRGSGRAACRELVSSCRQAGFTPAGSPLERFELREICLAKILETGEFNGITFDRRTLSRCKARIDRRKSKLGNS